MSTDPFDAVFNATGRVQRGHVPDPMAYARQEIETALQDHPSWLNLRDLQLTTLPPEIERCRGLRSLYLSGNALTAIPPAVFTMTFLQVLSLGRNELRQIPPTIGSLRHLRSLSLQENKISRVSDAIGKLTHLEILDLSKNRLTALPDALGNLVSLVELSLEGNNIEFIPEALIDIGSLEALLLNDNMVAELPERIGLMPSLKILGLENNRLTSLPASLARMRNIEHVLLGGNALPADLAFLTSGDGLAGVLQSRKTARRLADIRGRAKDFGLPEIPPPKPGKQFAVVDEKIDLVDDIQLPISTEVGDLIALLCETLDDLVLAADRHNYFDDLARIAKRYRSAISADFHNISIDACFTYGLRLRHAYRTGSKAAAAERYPVPTTIEEAVTSALALHGMIIPATERGRVLIEMAERERRARRDTARMRSVLQRLERTVEQRASILTPVAASEVKGATEIASTAGGDHDLFLEAVWTIFNFTRTLATIAIKAGPVIAGAALGDGFLHSAPGLATSGGLSSLFDVVWQIFLGERDLLIELAMTCGPDFDWIILIADWVKRADQRRK